MKMLLSVFVCVCIDQKLFILLVSSLSLVFFFFNGVNGNKAINSAVRCIVINKALLWTCL